MEYQNDFSELTTRDGKQLPLQDMAVSIILSDAFALVEQVQSWGNSETVNIEAVYSFPLPVQATLLALTVELNDRVLQGHVAERSKAERAYEDAMVDGDTAILLEQVEPGLYTLSIGNLLLSDTAKIRIRYALPLQWEQQQLRLALPTAVAPRYGNPSASGLQPHQVPVADVLAEHRYRLDMRVCGTMHGISVTSPSHDLRVSKRSGEVRVEFSDAKAHADRDLVICLISATAPIATASLATTSAARILHAAFPIPAREELQTLALKVLVDCSGSMLGDSIELARKAAQHALAQLQHGDSYSLSAFGSNVEHAPASTQQMQAIADTGLDPSTQRFMRRLDARLGGTDLVGALGEVFPLRAGADSDNAVADVLLITDGETWEREEIVRLCRDSQHRVFVIGCGACPAESVVREIAEATGGAVVFVGPNEDVKPIIDAHLQRMRQPRITQASLSLRAPLWQSPDNLTRCTFAGSTLHVFSALESAPDSDLELQLTYANGKQQTLRAAVHQTGEKIAGDLLRVAVAARIRETLFNQEDPDTSELTRLAVEHQLITPFTHCVMVEQRGAEAATQDPQLRQVPGMLAAGWSGTGIVVSDYGYLNLSMFMRRSVGPCLSEQQFVYRLDHSEAVQVMASPRILIDLLNPRFGLINPERKLLLTLSEIQDFCLWMNLALDEDFLDAVEQLIKDGWPESQVMQAFWQVLLDHTGIGRLFARHHRRAIVRTTRSTRVEPELLTYLNSGLAGSSVESWQWSTDIHQPSAVTSAQIAH